MPTGMRNTASAMILIRLGPLTLEVSTSSKAVEQRLLKHAGHSMLGAPSVFWF